MTAAKQILTDKFLKRFVPLGDLNAEQFNRIAQNSIVKRFEAGAKLFKLNDRDNKTIYLLSGQVTLTFRSGSERIITADTNQALHALVPEQPRQATAIAKTTINVLIIDSETLDQVLRCSEIDGYEVSELEPDQDNDWMTMFLQSKAFLKLRAQNIQALMMKLEEIPVKAGQVVVRQGDDDGYYYIIKRGKCRVTRIPPNNPVEIEVAVLESGAGFGEEALIMHDKRGATVTMIESGYLMRLSRQDFTRLLAEPLVQIASYKDVVKNQKSVFLDVRSYEEYAVDGITDCEICPLAELRAKIHAFDYLKQYVVVSDHGGRASAAAFLLCQQGFDAVVLAQGLAGLDESVARGNAAMQEDIGIPSLDNVINFTKDVEEFGSDNFSLDDRETGGIDQAIYEAHYDSVADVAKLEAQQEIERLRQEAEQQRAAIESESRRVAEAARMEAERKAEQQRVRELAEKQAKIDEAEQRARQEADRARQAEEARLNAESEIHKLRVEAEHARDQIQQRLTADIERSEREHEVARVRAEELIKKQTEIDEIARRADHESTRAQIAETARIEAESEVQRLRVEIEDLKTQQLQYSASNMTESALFELDATVSQKETEIQEITRQAEEEARRAQHFDLAYQQAQQEIARLKSEMETATRQAQAQLTSDAQRAAQEQSTLRQQARELEVKQQEIEQTIIYAQQEALKAKNAIEERIRAEQEAQQLRDQAGIMFSEAQEMLRKSEQEAREHLAREVSKIREQEAAKHSRELEEAARKAEKEARRAELAEKARLEAEREIERLKAAAGVKRIKTEKAIKNTIKTGSVKADISNRETLQSQPRLEKFIEKQEIVNGRDSIRDFFADEPPTDQQCNDEFNLLFTDVGNCGHDSPSQQSRTGRVVMSNDPKRDNDSKPDNSPDPWEAEEPTGGGQWVSDQVMWETALGFRQDEKISDIISPEKEAPPPPPPQQKAPVERQAPKASPPQARQASKSPSQQSRQGHVSDEKSVFTGRDVNPNTKRQVTIPVRRNRNLLKHAKKAGLWLAIFSPFIIAAGYYFSLDKVDRVKLQVSIASIFSSKPSATISEDAAKLIEETESRMDKGKKPKTTTAKAKKEPKTTTVSSSTSVPRSEDSGLTAPNGPQTFQGRDLTLEGDAESVAVPLPEGQSAEGQGVLPPIPEPTGVVTSHIVDEPVEQPVDMQEQTAPQEETFEHVPIAEPVSLPEGKAATEGD